MAINAVNRYDNADGVRESLADVISLIDPEDTPFVSNCAKVKVDNTYFEWLTDTLATPTATTAIEGADATRSGESDVTRLGNYTEIVEDTATVSGTTEALNRAGKRGEMAWQMMKKAKELRRQMEHHAVGIHQAQVAGNASGPTARKTASYAAFTGSNASVGATGSVASGNGTDVPTVGTARAYTESLLGTVIDNCWNAGGNPDIIMMGSFQKRAMNSFAGNTQDGSGTGNVFHDNTDKTIINATSVYVSDFGTMNLVPNRFCKSTDVLVYEREHWQIAELRPMQDHELAKNGDSEARQILCEWGLKCMNHRSSGAIFSLNDS